MPRVIHFEIPSSDVQRSIKFYQNVFGWTFQKWADQDYWLVMTGDPKTPGIDGGLMPKRDPAQPIVNTIDVSNLEETIAAIESAGGKIVVPKMAIPGVGWLAYFTDLDGYIHGIMQEDAGAK